MKELWDSQPQRFHNSGIPTFKSPEFSNRVGNLKVQGQSPSPRPRDFSKIAVARFQSLIRLLLLLLLVLLLLLLPPELFKVASFQGSFFSFFSSSSFFGLSSFSSSFFLLSSLFVSSSTVLQGCKVPGFEESSVPRRYRFWPEKTDDAQLLGQEIETQHHYVITLGTTPCTNVVLGLKGSYSSKSIHIHPHPRRLTGLILIEHESV